MYLFITTGRDILKYKVEFDEEKVLSIRKDILMNCCLFKRKKITTGVPKAFEINPNYVINSKYEFSAGLFSLDCYEVIYPNILKLIDRLLNGDASAVVEIELYVDEREYPKDKLDKLFNEFDKMNPSNKRAIQKKINEIKEEMNSVSINEKEQRVDKYLSELKDSIKLTLIDKMSYRDMYRFFNFVGGDVEQTFLRKLV